MLFIKGFGFGGFGQIPKKCHLGGEKKRRENDLLWNVL